MQKKTTLYTTSAIGALLLTLASCAQEGVDPVVAGGESRPIFFRSYLPGVAATRGSAISEADLKECRVTCFNPADTHLADQESGLLKPYFGDLRFLKDDDGLFLAEDKGAGTWPATKESLHFFAYHPPLDTMRLAAPVGTFGLANGSAVDEAGAAAIDYGIEDFRVATDIAAHFDFIAAHSDGTAEADGSSGVRLDFGHQLTRVELLAWGESLRYDIEIAGVRIGNALTRGRFSFDSLIPADTDSPETAPGEDNTSPWSGTGQSSVEYIFTPGDTVVHIGVTPETHIAKEASSSIMGGGGAAMVIPMSTRIEAWEGLGDPATAETPYSTDRLYLSVLLRVRDKALRQIYPYPEAPVLPDSPEGFPVVYLAVDKSSGVVNARVYRIGDLYYTAATADETLRYEPGDDKEIRGYCWAALPVAALWEAGKIYTYRLNYTDGLGWHDPSCPEPGKPIVDERVSINVEVTDWKEGAKSDVTVPRK